MDTDTQQSLLTSIKLMKELKDLIICEARAIFVRSGETSNTNSPPIYDVVTSKRIHPDGPEYEARLILYTTPALATWKMLMANPSCCMSPVDAMTDLLEASYERGHSERDGMCEGDVYVGEQDIV